MPNKPRILIFTLEFPPFIGGAGCFSSDLANGLNELGYSVTVLTRQYPAALHRREVRQSSRIVRFPWVRHVGFYYWPILLWWFLQKRKKHFDFILITESKAQAVSSMIPRSLLGKYGVTIHGEELQRHFEPRGLLRSLLYSSSRVRSLFANSKHLIAISASTQILAKQKGFVAHTLLLGIDANTFRRVPRAVVTQLRHNFGIRQDDVVIFTASRLHRDKGHDTLIRAMKDVRNSVPNAVLIIAGDGPDRTNLEKLATDEALSGFVRFLGPLERGSLPQMYQLSDLFVMTSRRENFGLVYIEANACGLTVVGGNVGGVPEAVIDGVTGLLVDPNSPAETAKAILKILMNPDRKAELEKNAYQRVQEKFTHVHMARNVLKLCGLIEGER